MGRADPGPLWSALAAADLGWCVFPCAPGAKRPALRENWQGLATTGADRIRSWWARQPYNVGIACGPSGLVGIPALDVKVSALSPIVAGVARVNVLSEVSIVGTVTEMVATLSLTAVTVPVMPLSTPAPVFPKVIADPAPKPKPGT